MNINSKSQISDLPEYPELQPFQTNISTVEPRFLEESFQSSQSGKSLLSLSLKFFFRSFTYC